MSNGGVEHIPFCQPGDASSLVPDPGLLQKYLQIYPHISNHLTETAPLPTGLGEQNNRP